MGRKKGGHTQAERCFLIINRLRGMPEGVFMRDLAEENVRSSVRTDWRALEVASKQYDLAQIGIDQAQRRLEEETLLLELGQGTTRDLIENWIQRPFQIAGGATVDIADANVRTIVAHDKVYAIHAMIKGKERYVVLTGTSNTTCGGLLYNDEMMVRLDGKWAFNTYNSHVLDAFKPAHQSRESASPVQAHCH